jgi:hypothetical protein
VIKKKQAKSNTTSFSSPGFISTMRESNLFKRVCSIKNSRKDFPFNYFFLVPPASSSHHPPQEYQDQRPSRGRGILRYAPWLFPAAFLIIALAKHTSRFSMIL